MGIFSWICVGAITGLLLNRVLALESSFLNVCTYVVAITGAVFGGFIGIRQGWEWGDITTFNLRSFSASLVGCALLVLLYVGVLLVSKNKNHNRIL